MKKLQEEIKAKKPTDPKTEEDKLKLIGLKTTSNIQTLIRDLFHSPPSYKSVVQLSWVQPKGKHPIKAAVAAKNGDAKPEVADAPVKRHAPITFSNGKDEDTKPAKQAKRNSNNNSATQMYSPPGGKFSSKFGGNNSRGGERKFGGGGGNRNKRPFGGGNRKQGGGGGGGGGRKFGGNAGRKSFRPY